MFKTRYTRSLESQIESLKLELERATLERQAAINAMLAHMGAPTLDLTDRPKIAEQPKRTLPSMNRRFKEFIARQSAKRIGAPVQ